MIIVTDPRQREDYWTQDRRPQTWEDAAHMLRGDSTRRREALERQEVVVKRLSSRVLALEATLAAAGIPLPPDPMEDK